MTTQDDEMHSSGVSANVEKFWHPFPEPVAVSKGREIYGLAGTPQLVALCSAMHRHATDIVSQFYHGLADLPASKCILDRLTDTEIRYVKSRQARRLRAMTAPALTAADHRLQAIRTGRTHAIVGLNWEDLVRARGVLGEAIFTHIDTAEHGEALCLLSRRMNQDMAWQAEAYQRLQISRHEALQRITLLAWKTESYTDLISQVVQILGAHDEIAGCAVGRPDRQGVFRFELAAGTTIEHYLAGIEKTAPITVGNSSGSQGPTGRAWRSGQVARSLNIANDPKMVPWRAAALPAGFHSCIAIPLRQPGEPTAAILNLYCPMPGALTGADQVAFVSLLQTILGFAIAGTERLAGNTRAVPYTVRQRWSALLRSDALTMHYQPLLDLKTGQVTKVEALARLRDGDRLLTPGEFFPALSSEDFLTLYKRGLEQALSQSHLWLKAGFPVNVSVNLPSSALGDIRYFKVTERALRTSGAAPNQLTLEVLETDAFPLGVDVPQELAKFKALGIQLAEDDLGSGYSTLTRLREVPFDLVKIDRNIVSAVDQDPADTLRFTYQLIQLGHSLNKAVVVEGIEDEGMLEAVVILGADIVQGYAIAHPMPAEQLTEWMACPPSVPDVHAPSTALGTLAAQLLAEARKRLM
ncbi:EAL domain-containing protein [Pandoraea terrigena]|uniref:Putative signaling protein n=1 Tax=Pandoraea terrigena TaxID=2508292 RepID=A0A5E4TAV9_9BURK|nr:EAL domain-containing protein [Pandoraea terrigena]VVD85065.1 putative signaling protein [Pandoraea terrigena]